MKQLLICITILMSLQAKAYNGSPENFVGRWSNTYSDCPVKNYIVAGLSSKVNKCTISLRFDKIFDDLVCSKRHINFETENGNVVDSFNCDLGRHDTVLLINAHRRFSNGLDTMFLGRLYDVRRNPPPRDKSLYLIKNQRKVGFAIFKRPARITTYAESNEFLNLVSDLNLSLGENLKSLQVVENFKTPADPGTCKAVPSFEVLVYVKNLVTKYLHGEHASYQKAYADLLLLLANDEYQMCTRFVPGDFTQEVTSFFTVNSDYRIEFSLLQGY